MNEPQIKQMSQERVLEVLNELKGMLCNNLPSKYFFALGHAIRALEKCKKRRTK